MARMSIIFDGFADLAHAIDKCGANLQEAVNEALEDTQKTIQNELTTAASIYGHKGGGREGYATPEMYNAILKNPDIEWKGTVAEVRVGFNLRDKGGFHSIFVMYGTKVNGTPRIKKDTKIYNAIRGVKIKKQIAERQEKIMSKHLRLKK